MKRFEIFFTFLQLPIDYLALILAGITAYSLRFTGFVTSIRPILFNLPWNKYWPTLLIVSLGWVIIFSLAGLYNADPNRKLGKELWRVILACSTGFAAITVYVFFSLEKFDSRFLVLTGWLLAMIFVCGGRIFLRLIKMLFYRLGFGLRRTVIIGRQSIALQLKEAFTNRPALGCKLLGICETFDLGTAKYIARQKPDEIIFTDPKANEDEALQAIDFATEHHLTFKYSADLFSTISTNMAVSTVAGIPIIELRRLRLGIWGEIAKRLADIFFGIFFLVIFSPLLLVSAIIILIETGRPVIYKNERVGRNGKSFFAYKFRSMHQKDCTGLQFGRAGTKALNKEETLIEKQSVKSGPVYKIKNDPRVTPFGHLIRRWSLDELPQFWNVVKGDMSLVGPRPHQPREVEKYQTIHKTVLASRPGLTGLSQISGRSDLNFDEEVKLDTFYLEHWSFFLDLIILLKTPFVVLFGKGAW